MSSFSAIIHDTHLYEQSREWTQAFGFHSRMSLRSFSNSTFKITNLMNALGAIPLLCIISAVYHLVKANEIEKRDPLLCPDGYVTALRGRAICELCQTSVFLALFDVFVTVIRHAG